MLHGLLAALGVALGVAGNIGNGGGQLLHSAGLLGSALGQSLRTGGHLLGAGRDLLGAEINLREGIAEVAVNGADGLQHGAQITDIELLSFCTAVEVAAAHLLQQEADVADDPGEDVLTGSQSPAHLAQLVLALIVHRNVQVALAETHQGHAHLLGGNHNALDDDTGNADHNNGGDNQGHYDSDHGNVGDGGLPLNDGLLLGLEPGGQGVAGGSRLVQGGGAVLHDHLGRLLLIGADRLADGDSLRLPALNQIQEGIQLGSVLQGVDAVQLVQGLGQHIDLAVRGVNAGHVAGQNRVAQVTGGTVVINAALRRQLSGLDIPVQNIGVLPLLYAHENQRHNNNDR